MRRRQTRQIGAAIAERDDQGWMTFLICVHGHAPALTQVSVNLSTLAVVAQPPFELAAAYLRSRHQRLLVVLPFALLAPFAALLLAPPLVLVR
jgi:hypothetical protein